MFFIVFFYTYFAVTLYYYCFPYYCDVCCESVCYSLLSYSSTGFTPVRDLLLVFLSHVHYYSVSHQVFDPAFVFPFPYSLLSCSVSCPYSFSSVPLQVSVFVHPYTCSSHDHYSRAHPIAFLIVHLLTYFPTCLLYCLFTHLIDRLLTCLVADLFV